MPADQQTPQSPVPLPPVNPKTPFEEFLLAEYNNIAQAHFNTVNSISEFFKQYIVIVSLPISLAVIFLKPAELKASGILASFPSLPFILDIFLNAISAAGLTVMAYIMNLRFDALLYARTVNGIRRYFYESSNMTSVAEAHVRVLPKQIHAPRYFEPYYFIFVVGTFALMGTVYSLAGWYCNWYAANGPVIWFWTRVITWPTLHFLVYGWLSQYREHQYLRSHIIGVDVDGVLNDHRRHFAEVLKERTGKLLDPEKITRIPVHEVPDTCITERDEHAVFNWPNYWTDMPPLDHVGESLNKLRHLLGFKIWIFTHRGWPQASSYPEGREKEYRTAWNKVSRLHGAGSERLIRKITKRWLNRNGIRYDRLVVERGNTDTEDPLIHTRNRFVTSQKRSIRFFVEDDLEKAKKLAGICEKVFLINHPYNTDDSGQLPTNIVRVNKWQEIVQYLRGNL